MSRADINRVIDPDSLPLLSEDLGPARPREQSDLDSVGLLDPLIRGSIDEMREEPPWIAEFLAQYRLVFGSSSRIAPPSRVQPEPVRTTETDSAFPRPLRAEIASSVVQPSPGPAVSSGQPSEQPLHSLKGPLVVEWSGTHTVIGLSIAVLLGAIILIALSMPRHHVNEKIDAADPDVGLHVAKVEATAPVTTTATNKQVASKESSDPFAGGKAAPSGGSPNVVDSSNSGSGHVPRSAGNGSVSLGAPSSLPPATFPKGDESIPGIPLRKVQPIYPSEALLKKVEGPVALEAEISQDGKVRAVTVVSGDPILARAAVVAVRQWIYPPSSSRERERRQQITIHFTAP